MEDFLGQRLLLLRKQRGLTQQQMAAFLTLARSTYVHYELGWRSPDIASLLRIARLLGVSLDFLTGNSDYPLTVEAFLKFHMLTLTRPVSSAEALLYTFEKPAGQKLAESDASIADDADTSGSENLPGSTDRAESENEVGQPGSSI